MRYRVKFRIGSTEMTVYRESKVYMAIFNEMQVEAKNISQITGETVVVESIETVRNL